MAALALLVAARACFGQAVLPSELLPGPEGTATGFGVAEVRDGTDLADISDAVTLVREGYDHVDSVVFGELSRLDASDFLRRPSGGDVIPGNALPLLADPPGEEAPNTVTVAHGRLRVQEAGTYTIHVHGSDGFAMRFPGHDWEQVFSWPDAPSAEIDPHDSETLLFRDRIGDTNTRGVITLPQGDADFEFVHYGGGFSYLTGIYFEVTSALGVHDTIRPAQWLPLGDGSILPAREAAPRDVRLTGPATLVAGDDLAVGLIEVQETVDYAREELPERVMPINQVVLVDEDGIAGREVCCTQPALALPELESYVIPYGDRRSSVGAGVFGEFTVDDGDQVSGETIPLTFAIFADDLAQVRIPGQDFISRNESVDLVDLEQPDGSMDVGLWAFLTEMQHHPLAHIELTEGTYDLETYLMQQAHGVGLEIWIATGLHEHFDLSVFYPLSISDELTPRPRNVGLDLVDFVDGLLGDFNEDGQLGVLDINLLTSRILAGEPDANYDLSTDGQLDADDVDRFLELAGVLNGDTDFNGKVEFADFLVLSANFQATRMDWSDGDFNASGNVDFADFLILSQNFGQQPAAAMLTVPEPDGLPLLLLLTATLPLTRNRRNRAS